MKTAEEVMDALNAKSSDSDATFLQRFFKTGKGEYGEGDVFLGVRVPETRKICKQAKNLSLQEIEKLLQSTVHEHRLAAVFILSEQYKKQPQLRKDIYNLYIKNVKLGNVNNWDIVDLSAKFIVGPYLENSSKKPIFDLAKSRDIWHRRVAVLATFDYINKGNAELSLELAELLLYDKHDLMHKAVGWMLREVGKRVDRKLLLDFLDEHASEMPRTMLRYSIEHLPEAQRKHYMTIKNIN